MFRIFTRKVLAGRLAYTTNRLRFQDVIPTSYRGFASNAFENSSDLLKRQSTPNRRCFISTTCVACLENDTTFNTDLNLTQTDVLNEIPNTEFTDVALSSPVNGLESFADYGLGGWDLPHHWVQSMLEVLHSQMGIHWIPTLMIATVTCRLLALPAYVKMRDFIVRSHNHLPQQMKIQQEMQHLRGLARQRKAAEYMDFLRDKDMNPLKALLYQMPTMITFMSFFAALRGIAEAGLPSFTTSGLFWFGNLAIPDPYYILPIASCVSMHLLIRFGAATAEAGPATNVPIVKKILMWSPFVCLPFFFYQPAAMFVFWLTSNLFSLVQMNVFLLPQVKRFFNIQEMTQHPKAVIEAMQKQMNPFEMARKQKEQQRVAESAAQKMQEHMRQLQKFSKDKKNP
uniref:Mitochondrial inner membrane protein OXA1L n=1 Tax=Phallusia mammillata TaxID=59560 RepID=A0A6F9DME3_9ASCI|nr:mitochondrial inner membrane protein OXA1L [Phallusia mammillata]